MLNAAQSYKQAQVNTVGRADITLMLYDGLLRFLDLAAENMEQKNIQEKGNCISRALDIIHELDSTLNMEKGGEVAKGLHNLYLITNKNLLMANLKNDLAVLKSVRQNMQVVRDSFFEAMQTKEAKEMLLKMGPVPSFAGNSGGQLHLGGSIRERAEHIKEARQKVEAIQRAKEKLETAKTDEEKLLAKNELEALLGKKIAAAQSKPVSVSMAQRASRVFMQQQGMFCSQSFSKGAAVSQGDFSAAKTDASAMQLKAYGQYAGQSAVLPQGARESVSPLQKQSAILGHNAMQAMAENGSQTVNAVRQSEMPAQHIVTENGQADMPQEMPQYAVQPKSSPMNSLLSKKMSLYKSM